MPLLCWRCIQLRPLLVTAAAAAALLQMAGDKRVTYTRRHAYATASNKIKVVRTPGGKHVGHYRKKKANGPKCGDCKIALPGVSAMQNAQRR